MLVFADFLRCCLHEAVSQVTCSVTVLLFHLSYRISPGLMRKAAYEIWGVTLLSQNHCVFCNTRIKSGITVLLYKQNWTQAAEMHIKNGQKTRDSCHYWNNVQGHVKILKRFPIFLLHFPGRGSCCIHSMLRVTDKE